MYYAEDNLDQFIREKFFPNQNDNHIMVEVGAGPPIFYSMSKHFRDSGWRCICVEPNPKFVEQHQKLGNEIYNYACSNENKISNFTTVLTDWHHDINGISYSALENKYPGASQYPTETYQVEVIKLSDLLKNIDVKKIDLLSIDVEGWEIEVMQGFDINYHNPKVVILENWLHISDYTNYMNSLGYTEYIKVNHNYIYIKK